MTSPLSKPQDTARIPRFLFPGRIRPPPRGLPFFRYFQHADYFQGPLKGVRGRGTPYITPNINSILQMVNLHASQTTLALKVLEIWQVPWSPGRICPPPTWNRVKRRSLLARAKQHLAIVTRSRVASNALRSYSPSLIWLLLGFALAWAVTKFSQCKVGNLIVQKK